MKIGTASMQNSGEVPQKANNRNAIGYNKPTARTEVRVPETWHSCVHCSSTPQSLTFQGRENGERVRLAFSERTVLSYDHTNEMDGTILSEISEMQKHSRPHLSMISKTNSIAEKDGSCQGLVAVMFQGTNSNGGSCGITLQSMGTTANSCLMYLNTPDIK